MADSAAFELVSEEIARRTVLNRIEARGTVRLVLREGGLDASSVRPAEMAVVVVRLLAGALTRRGVEGAQEICRAMVSRLSALDEAPPTENPETIFQRLAND